MIIVHSFGSCISFGRSDKEDFHKAVPISREKKLALLELGQTDDSCAQRADEVGEMHHYLGLFYGYKTNQNIAFAKGPLMRDEYSLFIKENNYAVSVKDVFTAKEFVFDGVPILHPPGGKCDTDQGCQRKELNPFTLKGVPGDIIQKLIEYPHLAVDVCRAKYNSSQEQTPTPHLIQTAS
jgi:hypothetical protein